MHVQSVSSDPQPMQHASQWTATEDDAPAKPTGLDDRGDGQATYQSLRDVLSWARHHWPQPAKLRDAGQTHAAIATVASGVADYSRQAQPDVTRATQAAAWLLTH